jgi:hypothetical protein
MVSTNIGIKDEWWLLCLAFGVFNLLSTCYNHWALCQTQQCFSLQEPLNVRNASNNVLLIKKNLEITSMEWKNTLLWFTCNICTYIIFYLSGIEIAKFVTNARIFEIKDKILKVEDSNWIASLLVSFHLLSICWYYRTMS